MPEYDVHLYPVVRLTLRRVKADNHEEALAKALEEFDKHNVSRIFTSQPRGGWESTYSEELQSTAVVDELDEEGQFGEVKEVKLSDVEVYHEPWSQNQNRRQGQPQV